MSPAWAIFKNDRWLIGNHINCDNCGKLIFFEWPQNPRGKCPECGKYTSVLMKEKVTQV